MTKHTHCYINDDNQVDGGYNVSLDNIRNTPNGSCDILSFHELNNVPLDQIDPIVGGLSRKIKINQGLLLLQYLNFDKIYNDITYDKISIDNINKFLANKTNYFFEDYLDNIFTKYQLTIKQIIYDNYITQIAINRHS
jgi:hypothetical protein